MAIDGVREAVDEVLGFDPATLAKLLGLDVHDVRARIRAGDLPAIEWSERNWFIPRRKLLDELDARAEREAEARRLQQQPINVQLLSDLPRQAHPRRRSQ